MNIASLYSRIRHEFNDAVADNDKRLRIQYICAYLILAVVSIFMSIMNIVTKSYTVLVATVLFAAICISLIVMAQKGKKWLNVSTRIFTFSILALFVFFIVSGSPDGFSAIWALMLPSCGLLLFEMKRGAGFSLLLFAIIAFFFWTPVGKSLLLYDYNPTFMERFPLAYLAFFAMAVFLELIRYTTFRNYRFLFTHDPLTKALNRNGFSEELHRVAHDDKNDVITFMIFDLDYFKRVNDTYGHMNGDKVLRMTAKYLKELTGLKICRWGGEEFAAVDRTGAFDAEKASEVVRGFAGKVFDLGDVTIPMTVSLGAFRVRKRHGLKTDEIITKADECLYEAKQTGRDKAVFREEL